MFSDVRTIFMCAVTLENFQFFFSVLSVLLSSLKFNNRNKIHQIHIKLVFKSHKMKEQLQQQEITRRNAFSWKLYFKLSNQICKQQFLQQLFFSLSAINLQKKSNCFIVLITLYKVAFITINKNSEKNWWPANIVLVTIVIIKSSPNCVLVKIITITRNNSKYFNGFQCKIRVCNCCGRRCFAKGKRGNLMGFI